MISKPEKTASLSGYVGCEITRGNDLATVFMIPKIKELPDL